MAKFARVIDSKSCMGCQSCVSACMMENHCTSGTSWNTMLEFESGKYPKTKKMFITMGCMHCDKPACMAACKKVGANAITKKEDGAVLIDYNKCIGCRECEAVCPYGVPRYNEKITPLYPGTKGTEYESMSDEYRHPTHRKKANTVEKCTFCRHKIEQAIKDGKTDEIGDNPEYTPTCDVVCPVRARTFGDVDNPDSKVSTILKSRKAVQIKKEFGTGPQVHYLLEEGVKL